MPDRQQLQAFHPFARLNRLLEGITPPSAEAPILLSVGEPQNQPPAFVAEELASAAAGWSRYPPPRGSKAYREASIAWLRRRYGLPDGMVDPERHILPLPGSREGLFFAAVTAVPSPDRCANPAEGPGAQPLLSCLSGRCGLGGRGACLCRRTPGGSLSAGH